MTKTQWVLFDTSGEATRDVCFFMYDIYDVGTQPQWYVHPTYAAVHTALASSVGTPVASK